MAGPLNTLLLYRGVLVVLLGIVVYFLVSGFGPLLTSPRISLDVLDWKGGGWAGYRLGYAGTVMLVIAQAYLFRPRILNKLILLNMHCYLTTAGGTLILLHSGFPYSFTYWNFHERIYPSLGVYGLVGMQGLAAWMVLLLIASGFYGRYLYGKTRAFKKWHLFHSVFSAVLYVAGVIHLMLVVTLKHVSAV
ncbi:MAG: hypothetical protein QXY84_05310 [Candidatus Caldarchaeum sp.]|uniref:Ferric oxidoreductase domain-containing protein n=1 Tax=Caldiarchaeum subterraneum TaxID=311458 RepID=A0A7C5U6R7_CALS0